MNILRRGAFMVIAIPFFVVGAVAGMIGYSILSGVKAGRDLLEWLSK